jgi:hypothetical protein
MVEDAVSADVVLRHFEPMRTGWKVAGTKPGYPLTQTKRPGWSHEVDEELLDWMACFQDAGGIPPDTGEEPIKRLLHKLWRRP